ncbi:acyltransferase family protein [Mesorhizobium helmanticense]|uniref:Acyltransferase 3 domain-containing protein n=1 Tax=Mesorhizobium helmanticense TaxID=1776423 RepID=A0A2T4J1R1_9HYPH|nr:acyltransferase family protein [Mesorhizobium helmanticense]PTE11768.1 hypothetical protein C9427_03500 [Mesorhizobium helmanticense]
MLVLHCTSGEHPQRQGRAIAILGVTAFFTTAFFEHDLGHVWGAWFYAVSSMIIVVGLASKDLTSTITWPRIGMLFGDASYSIYLVHFPVIVAFNKLCLKVAPAMPSPAIQIGSIAAGLAAGVFFHFVVERPLLNAGFFRRKAAIA